MVVKLKYESPSVFWDVLPPDFLKTIKSYDLRDKEQGFVGCRRGMNDFFWETVPTSEFYVDPTENSVGVEHCPDDSRELMFFHTHPGEGWSYRPSATDAANLFRLDTYSRSRGVLTCIKADLDKERILCHRVRDSKRLKIDGAAKAFEINMFPEEMYLAIGDNAEAVFYNLDDGKRVDEVDDDIILNVMDDNEKIGIACHGDHEHECSARVNLIPNTGIEAFYNMKNVCLRTMKELKRTKCRRLKRQR